MECGSRTKTVLPKKFQGQLRQRPFLELRMGVCALGVRGVRDTGIPIPTFGARETLMIHSLWY